MNRVFIYWDNSNIFHEAQRLAEALEQGSGARYRVRIHFESMFRLAHADRPVQKALAAGAVPPEMRQLWNRMEGRGVDVHHAHTRPAGSHGCAAETSPSMNSENGAASQKTGMRVHGSPHAPAGHATGHEAQPP